jgi:hypothetical protein
MDSRYPKDWPKIATALKEREQWRCYRCGVQCFSPSRRPLHGFRDSKRRIYLLQVHHWDGQPENNDLSNLVCLCTRCHLYVHRRRGGSVLIERDQITNINRVDVVSSKSLFLRNVQSLICMIQYTARQPHLTHHKHK